MIRKLLVFILFLSGIPAFSQIKTLQFNENQKQWAAGKLTWNDFQGKPMPVAPTGSELIYFFYYQPEKVKTADTVFFRLRTIAFIDRQQSWVQDSAKTDLQLKFNQAIFNTLEWHRRKLENRFLKVFEPQKEAPELFNAENRIFRETVARLSVETRNGNDEAKVNNWLIRSYQKLDSIDTGRLPGFQVANFGMSAQIGYEQTNLAGEIGSTFTGFSGVTFGSTYQFKNLVLFINMNGASGKTTAVYEEMYQWPEGINIYMNQFSAAAGYQLLDAPHWRLTPFAGPTTVIISPKKDAGESYRNQEIQDNTMIYGLQLDWKIRNQVSLIPVNARSAVLDHGIRTRFTVCPLEFTPAFNGAVFNVSFSIYGNMRFINFR